jgi:hypothetical protein
VTDAPRVHSHLPEHLHGIVTEALGEIEHLPHTGEHVEAAEAASADPRCVAFIGPLLSWQVAETGEILNQAGIAQLAIGSTYSALTRKEPGAYDGMPASLSPTGERTIFRLVPRDAAIARAVVARWPVARLVSDGSDYALQLAPQLQLAGLREDEAADVTIYAGLAEEAPDLGGGELVAFEGAALPGFPEHALLVLPQRGGEGWSAGHAILYAPQAKEAAMLVYGSAMAGGPTRAGVLRGLRSCGRFDEYGDTLERKVGLWRWLNGELVPDGTLEDPGR